MEKYKRLFESVYGHLKMKNVIGLEILNNLKKVEKKMEHYVKRFKLNESEFKGDSHYEHLYHDRHMAHEIELYLDNDAQLYKQQFIPIIKNLQKKIKSNKYDHKLAPKLWVYFVENGLKKYAKENSVREWHSLLNTKDRLILATKLADYYYDNIMNGDYDHI